MIFATAKPLLASAALVCALGAGWWLHAGMLRAQLDAARDAGKATAAALKSAEFANAEWEASALDAQLALNTCQAQWVVAKESAARAQAQAEQGRRDAERVRAAFLDRYAGRGAQCSDALAALDSVCADLEGY